MPVRALAGDARRASAGAAAITPAIAAAAANAGTHIMRCLITATSTRSLRAPARPVNLFDGRAAYGGLASTGALARPPAPRPWGVTLRRLSIHRTAAAIRPVS